MEELSVLKLFFDYGFPSVLCIFTLFELNKNLKKLTAAIDKLTGDFDKRLDNLENEQKELRHQLEVRRN